MELQMLPNKKFAFSCLELLKAKHIPLHRIQDLTDREYCKIHFNTGKPILKQISGPIPGEEDIYDQTGRQRFYRDVWTCYGNYYLVTNYWYGPNTNVADNRTPFLNWVMAR